LEPTPEQRQSRNNGPKFIVLSVATQRSWKNADDEWSSKTEWHRVVVIWNLTGKQEELATGQVLTRNAY
jgi:PadR family transcriptional regulator PadR